MFFKNLLLYRMVESFAYSHEDFNDLLRNLAYKPCPKSENNSIGWVSPYSLDNDSFVHSLKGYFLFAFCKEEKILPAAVIKEELTKKVADLQQREDRIIYRKEKADLKDQIIINLRHQAFSQKKITFAYIDLENRWLLIDTASRNKAEEICSFLRKTLGSLKLALPTTNCQPEFKMTSWLREKQQFNSFNIENNCDMLDPKQKSGMIKCKEQDLNADEIIRHLQLGKQIVKLALNWENKISFDFSNDLIIRKIRFLDLLQKQREEIKDQSIQQQIDSDFAIMAGEFSQFLPHLWLLFEGLAPLEN